MYHTATSVPSRRPVPEPASGFAGIRAMAVTSSMLVIGGTGSVFDLQRIGEWGPMLDARIPHFEVQITDAVRPDIRSAAEHLVNIRQVFNPAIADLAAAFGVSRQAIYKWIGSESTPEDDKLERLRTLSLAADAFQVAGVQRAASLLKMKAFDGRSLLDLVAADQLLPKHAQVLIAEAQAMDAAYQRSGLARSKAPASDDWRAALSIPGTSE